jgi:Zn-finger in Ran binding protein and others
MDTGLFQALALVLLAVIAILLGAMASLLARIRRALEQPNLGEANLGEAASAQQAAPLSASSAQAAEGAATEARPEEARVEAVRRLEPSPAAEATGYAEEEAAVPRAVSVFEAEEAASATGPEEEPQEQPFERDGRWWFRRGDELLVYDEQTGQWLAAPAPTVAASVAQGGQGATPSAAVATETRTSVSELSSANSEPSSEHSGGFWKCPSCGAVNGSTATSCRMCFSARPS